MAEERLSMRGKAPHSLGHLLREPRFWAKAWERARRHSLAARRRPDLSPLDYWDRLAGKFEHWASEERTQKRVARVLSWLEEQGVLEPGMEVLDIGAGTGTFALPFARRGAKVTALEPAPAMLAALQKKVEAQGLANVRFLAREWEKVDPVAEGLAGKFDLVFASLTPGVQDVVTLEKMMACSRQWCFLCDFAGRRREPAREELWWTIFGEEMPLSGHEVLYTLNYLYASGYCPSFQVWVEDWGEELPVKEAVAGLEEFFALYTEVTPEIKKAIVSYVEERAASGIYKEEHRVRLGMVLWARNEKWEA